MSIVINNPGGGGSSFGQGFPLGTNLPNALFVNQTTVVSSATTTDFYTVPANRRAYLVSVAQGNTNATSSCIKVKISGTYYPLSPAAASTEGNMFFPPVPYVAEAGEIFAITTTGATTCTFWLAVIEFDNTSNLRTSKVTSFINGNNTVYTVPALKTAILMSVNQIGGGFLNNVFPAQGAPGFGTVGYGNKSGGLRAVQAYLVPSGQSVGATYSFSGSASNVGDGNTLISGFPTTMNTGDFTVLASDASTAQQIGWCTVVEM